MTAAQGSRRNIPWRLIGWGAAAVLLATPLVAMRFTDEVNWTASDFLFMGMLFGVIGGLLELAVRKSGRAAYRLGVAVALAIAFFSIWLTGAVGIIGSENETANLLYLAVLVAALAGAFVARFQPEGMARAMVVAAVAELIVPPAAAIFWPEAREAIWRREVFVLTGGFVFLWLVAAALFRKAAR
ncbi:hypothetical protein [Phenylobacterium sp.]|jgi:hypothetical protein|uniref:hypothetical protein n=1 Tax=Phenylobacterium sp. TaxID=1871053 RepID=UPI00378364FB